MSNLTRTLVITTSTSINIFKIYLDWFGEVLAVIPTFAFDVKSVVDAEDNIFTPDTWGHDTTCGCSDCWDAAAEDDSTLDTRGCDPICSCSDCEDEVLRDMWGPERVCCCPDCESEELRDMDGCPIRLNEPFVGYHGYLETKPTLHVVN